jgi:DNA-binding transcriptional ArsR family regulator
MPEVPHRELSDPQALRAFAHPVRLRLLEELVATGPSTATQLAERVGESPANCSWHLRQLARYGFVEEAGGGSGRQRPWKFVMQGNIWGRGEESPELARAGDAAAEVLFGREYEVMRAWHAARRAEPPQWRDAGFVNQSVGWLTAEELSAVDEEIRQVLMRYLDRLEDSSRRPPGARLIRFVAWGVPGQPYDADEETE